MQEIATIEPKIINQTKPLSSEEKQRLVAVFAWLIQEDKKQNPALYQTKKQKND